MSDEPLLGDDRLLTFEVEGSVYALPAEDVIEVAELDRVTFVPGLPSDCGGVMNWNGDALPLLSAALLLAPGSEEPCATGEATRVRPPAPLAREFALVIGDRTEVSASLAVPVDRVLGFEPGRVESESGSGFLVERRLLGGRSVGVLDARGLVARAVQVIDSARV